MTEDLTSTFNRLALCLTYILLPTKKPPQDLNSENDCTKILKNKAPFDNTARRLPLSTFITNNLICKDFYFMNQNAALFA